MFLPVGIAFPDADYSPPVTLIASLAIGARRGVVLPTWNHTELLMCIGTYLVSQGGPPSTIRLHALGQAYQFSRASSHANAGQMGKHAHPTTVLHSLSCFEFAWAQWLGFCQSPPERDTRPKQSTASRSPCERDDTRVEPRRREVGGQVWTNKTVIWAVGPPFTEVTDCRALLQTCISASAHNAAVHHCRRRRDGPGGR